MREIKKSNTELSKRNRNFEKQRDDMDRVNNINSNIGRSVTLLSATLLPVGMWGSFFSLTKFIDGHNWGFYWLAILASWLVLALVFYIWGVFHDWWGWRPWKTHQGRFLLRRYSVH